MIIVGLGNPGEEHERTRHNVGRRLVAAFGEKQGFPELVYSGKFQSLISKGTVENETVTLCLPETYMNKSGNAVKTIVKSERAAKNLVVVYDDLDLPFGTIRVAFGRGSGGHKGIESVVRGIRTKDFIRVRIGVAPSTEGGKLRKPKGEKAVIDFLLGNFKKGEEDELKKIEKRTGEILTMLAAEGAAMAMNAFNSK